MSMIRGKKASRIVKLTPAAHNPPTVLDSSKYGFQCGTSDGIPVHCVFVLREIILNVGSFVVECVFDLESIAKDLDLFIGSSTGNDLATSSVGETDHHLTDCSRC